MGGIQGHPWLLNEFEASLKYMSPCLKNKTEQTTTIITTTTTKSKESKNSVENPPPCTGSRRCFSTGLSSEEAEGIDIEAVEILPLVVKILKKSKP